MNPSIRRETPDSEVIASSEDERPWPAAPSFGGLPHKENSVPGLGGSIWSTNKRGSFKMEQQAQRNAAREARLGAPGQPRSNLRNGNTPSPSASDGSGALPFQIPLHPAPKAGRSLSHSQGQREYPPVSSAHSTQPDHAPALPLGLLAEEVDTESESELGVGLTHTTSHPPIGTLHRTATFPATYDSYYAAPNGKEHGETAGGAQGGSRGDRRFEAAFANLSLATDQQHRRPQWQTHLGWDDDVLNVNESRRHSLADIPTRRGSVVGGTEHRSGGGAPYWPDGRAYDWEGGQHAYNEHQYREPAQLLDYNSRMTSSSNDAEMLSRQFAELRATMSGQSGQIDANAMPQAYKLDPITLPDHERAGQDTRSPPTMGPATGQQFHNTANRPRKLLYIVSFKCSRVDVFYLLDNTGLKIKEGDIVIVEADRGQDLGTVQHAEVTPDEARNYKRRYGEEQYKWLMMFSKNNNQGSVNPNAQVYGEENRAPAMPGSAARPQGGPPQTAQGLPRDNHNNLKPKAIKRLANNHEIRMLAEKEGNEAKAKRTCQNKVSTLHLDMEILDAEWQWDFQKLIFYYYADHYINFKDLITELYRIYKTRIWLSAINPASFSQHALGSPPSGIGPGALNPADREAYYSNLATGADPDPYGAVPPYRIGYDTYTPNYPGIPGVVNSFVNPMPMQFPPMPGQGPQNPGLERPAFGSGNATPSGGMPSGMPGGWSGGIPDMNNMPLYGDYGNFPSYGGYTFGNFGDYGYNMPYNRPPEPGSLPGTTPDSTPAGWGPTPTQPPTQPPTQAIPVSSGVRSGIPWELKPAAEKYGIHGPYPPFREGGALHDITSPNWDPWLDRGKPGRPPGTKPGSKYIPPIGTRTQPPTHWKDFPPTSGANPMGDDEIHATRGGDQPYASRTKEQESTQTSAPFSGQLPQQSTQIPPSFGGSSQQRSAPMPTSFGGSPQQIRFGARSDNTAKAGLMETFLDSLQSTEDAMADEMSRER